MNIDVMKLRILKSTERGFVPEEQPRKVRTIIKEIAHLIIFTAVFLTTFGVMLAFIKAAMSIN